MKVVVFLNRRIRALIVYNLLYTKALLDECFLVSWQTGLNTNSRIFSARKTIIKNFVVRAENSPKNTDSTVTYVKEKGRNKKSDFHLVWKGQPTLDSA